MSIDINSLDPNTVMKIMEDQVRDGNLNSLKQYRSHENPSVRGHIVRLITKHAFDQDVKSFYKDALKDTSPSVRLELINSIEKLYQPAYKEKYTTVWEDGNIKSITTDSKKLDNFYKNYFPILIEALKDSDERNQRKAIDALVEIGDSRALGYIIKLFKPQDSNIHEYAENAVDNREYGWGKEQEKAIPALLEALKDTNLQVKLGAIEYLSITGEKGIAHIIKSLDDKNPEIRKKACTALTSTRDILYLQELIRMSKDPDKGVRETVSKRLSTLIVPSYLY